MDLYILNVFQIFRKNDTSINTTENIDLSDIDPKLLENIMPFQREGIWYVIYCIL